MSNTQSILARWRDEHTAKALGFMALAEASFDAAESESHRETAEYHRQQADICERRISDFA